MRREVRRSVAKVKSEIFLTVPKSDTAAEIDAAREKMRRNAFRQGNGGIPSTAISGIDITPRDISGKHARERLFEKFGRPQHDWSPVNASSLVNKNGEAACVEDFVRYLKTSFRSCELDFAKRGEVNVGGDPYADVRFFLSLRRAFGGEVDILAAVPGIDRAAARAILVELGPKADSFPARRHCAAWAGLCPGNNESTGKNKRLNWDGAFCPDFSGFRFRSADRRRGVRRRFRDPTSSGRRRTDLSTASARALRPATTGGPRPAGARPRGRRAGRRPASGRSRPSRRRHLRSLAPFFALSTDIAMREEFRRQLALFPAELPYDYEEERGNSALEAELQEQAEQWVGFGDASNFRASIAPDGQRVMIGYESPAPISAARQQKMEEASVSPNELDLAGWAAKSLQNGSLDSSNSLESSVAFASTRDTSTLFDSLAPARSCMTQSAVSGVAACVLLLGESRPEDEAWALNVMRRVETMQEERDGFGGGNSRCRDCGRRRCCIRSAWRRPPR